MLVRPAAAAAVERGRKAQAGGSGVTEFADPWNRFHQNIWFDLSGR